MPPQFSDDEGSVASEVHTPPKVEKTKAGKKAASIEEPEEELQVESDKEEDEEDDETGEDVYVVEAIMSHLVDDESGELRFEVKWEGFEKKSDRTWEPEENLETADKILSEYLSRHGGKDAILAAYHEKKNAGGTKKRGRASTGGAENGAKRGKKSNGTVVPSYTPAGSEFKPPSGNWEEEVVHIDACEGTEGSVVVYLTWKGGQKTQHPLVQVYKRCPQKMLKFYESHLVFKRNDEPA